MYIEQLYTGCLAQAAYYIESNKEVAIIDPLRETSPYLELAKKRGAKIKYVFETHFHADFVSGHIDLAERTGAKIIYGPGAKATYDIHEAKDEEIFQLGNTKIKVLHTPGHTLESCCYLLIDKENKEHAVFTGDTLFIGDVGRPDLAVKAAGINKEHLAGLLYDSINSKLMTLADDVIVYPGHGAGSQCGKNMSTETQSTIGEQRQYNYALQAMTKEEFIEQVTEGLTTPPPYFFKDSIINRTGYEEISGVMERNLNPLTNEEFEREMDNGALVLDTRTASEFHNGFIKGSINIGLDGMYAVWVGTLLDIERSLLIISEEGREEESIMRLARVGYENIKGYLKGGMNGWIESGRSIDTIESIAPEKFAEKLNVNIEILDVRRQGEYDEEQLEGAINIPLDALPDSTNTLDKSKKYYVHCRSGYRSMAGCSILKARGFDNLINIAEGMEGMKKAGVETVSTVIA